MASCRDGAVGQERALRPPRSGAARRGRGGPVRRDRRGARHDRRGGQGGGAPAPPPLPRADPRGGGAGRSTGPRRSTRRSAPSSRRWLHESERKRVTFVRRSFFEGVSEKPGGEPMSPSAVMSELQGPLARGCPAGAVPPVSPGRGPWRRCVPRQPRCHRADLRTRRTAEKANHCACGDAPRPGGRASSGCRRHGCRRPTDRRTDVDPEGRDVPAGTPAASTDAGDHEILAP